MIELPSVEPRNIVAIVQCRMGSSRLPGKAMLDICGRPLIWHVFDRLRHAKLINQCVLATTTDNLDDSLVSWAAKQGIQVFRGSTDDVLDRYWQAASFYNADIIVRITADDPLKDVEVLDGVVHLLLTKELDFAYNNHPPTFPEGLDVEVFSYRALARMQEEASSAFEREHVTPYLFAHPELFLQSNLPYSGNLSHLRWTIDVPEDLKMTRQIYQELFVDGGYFGMEEVVAYLRQNPDVAALNRCVSRSALYANLEPV